MRPLRVLPAADRDVDDAADYYVGQAGAEVAVRFLSAVREAYRFLAETPGAGAPVRWISLRLGGVRRWPVRGFENYLIFYRETEWGLEVIRVLHGARDLEAILDEE